MKKYDKEIQWTVNNRVEVQLVHDVGAERIPEMIPLNTTKGVGISVYTLAR